MGRDEKKDGREEGMGRKMGVEEEYRGGFGGGR